MKLCINSVFCNKMKISIIQFFWILLFSCNYWVVYPLRVRNNANHLIMSGWRFVLSAFSVFGVCTFGVVIVIKKAARHT